MRALTSILALLLAWTASTTIAIPSAKAAETASWRAEDRLSREHTSVFKPPPAKTLKDDELKQAEIETRKALADARSDSDSPLRQRVIKRSEVAAHLVEILKRLDRHTDAVALAEEEYADLRTMNDGLAEDLSSSDTASSLPSEERLELARSFHELFNVQTDWSLKLSSLYIEIGRTEDSEKLIDELIVRAREVFEAAQNNKALEAWERDRLRHIAAHRLFEIFRSQNRFEEAEAWALDQYAYQSQQANNNAMFKEAALRKASWALNLADLYVETGREDDAGSMIDELKSHGRAVRGAQWPCDVDRDSDALAAHSVVRLASNWEFRNFDRAGRVDDSIAILEGGVQDAISYIGPGLACALEMLRNKREDRLYDYFDEEDLGRTIEWMEGPFNDLAEYQVKVGRVDEAEATLRRKFAFLKADYETMPRLVAGLYRERASFLLSVDRPDAASAVGKDYADWAQQLSSPDDQLALSLDADSRLGQLYANQKQFDAAVQAAERGLDRLIAGYPELKAVTVSDRPSARKFGRGPTGLELLLRSAATAAQYRYATDPTSDAAAPLVRAATAIRADAPAGREAAALVELYAAMAKLASEQDDLEVAERRLKEGLEIVRALSASTAENDEALLQSAQNQALKNLLGFYELNERTAEAEALVNEGLADTPDLASALATAERYGTMAQAAAARGDEAGAERALKQALDVVRSASEGTDIGDELRQANAEMTLLAGLAEFYVRSKRLDEAARVLEERRAVLDVALTSPDVTLALEPGKVSELRLSSLRDLVGVYAELGRYDEADATIDEMISLIDAHPFDDEKSKQAVKDKLEQSRQQLRSGKD